ncbi:MAG: LysE family translocator [Giesbergeria sp.]|nr:LysE family translocator [Comamonadaceae bacterium]
MTMEAHQLLLFIAAGWLLNLTPGPDVLYIVSNALRHGARAGVVASLGIALGCMVHVAAAAVGVGALLAASATAFTVLKVLGAAYLLWMGVRMLLSRAPGGGSGAALAAAQAEPVTTPSLARVFMGGFWTNVLNPKVVIFFLAFVPQFIAPGTTNKALVFVLLGVLFSVNAIPVNAGWALAAAWMAKRAGAVQRGMHWLDRAAGALFIGFGLKLAWTDAPSA